MVSARVGGKAKKILGVKRRKVTNKSLSTSLASSMPVTSSSSISPESEISSDSDGLCDAHPLRVSVLEVDLNAGIQYENEKLQAQELRNEALKDQPGQYLGYWEM